jgi:DNA-binding transcriptional MerR regulator
MLQVGEVSQKLGVNPQTLYFYERIELIPPPQRTSSGYRLFSEKDIERLTFISRARALGLSLEEIKEILMLRDGQLLTCRDVYDRFLRKVQQIEDNIQQLQTLRNELLPLVQRCRTNLDHPDSTMECAVWEEFRYEIKDDFLG